MSEKISSISEIFNTEPGLAKIKNVIDRADVVREFPEIFPDLVKIASAVKVDKETLFLRVENSVWRSELRLKEKLIVEKINRFFKGTRIKQVKFIP